MNVLTIDIGGTNVKMLASGQSESRRFPSGPTLTPAQMVAGARSIAADWPFDAVSIGYPGVVRKGRIAAEPHNLGPGWVGFDFEEAFGCPVRILNDAAMQALGSYREGDLLFLGLGTGLGSAMIVDGNVVPMELAHLPYKKGTFEDYVGARGLERRGRRKWESHVHQVIEQLSNALLPDEVVLGGGNTKKLKTLPEGCRAGDNANAFVGGFRMWESPMDRQQAGVAAASIHHSRQASP
jgi:predicted NBD/HSP70 family sugar kinase